MICRSRSLEERCEKTSQMPGNLIDQGLNLVPKGKKTGRGGGQAETENKTPHSMRLTVRNRNKH
jgi:hypothetical protein